MKEIETSQCRAHVLVCVNEREGEKTCCHKVGGLEFFRRLRERLRESGQMSQYWSTKTGCLGFCNTKGCTIAIHRPGQSPKWYNEITSDQFETIWEELTQTPVATQA